MSDLPTKSLLPQSWEVPDSFRRRLGDEPGRQRVFSADGHLLLILHAPPDADASKREGRFFWRSPEGRWLPGGKSPGAPGVGELLASYEQAIDALQQAEDAATTARDYFELLGRLTPLMRATRNLHQTMDDARKTAPDDRQLLLWRDRSYSLSRSVELLHADARHALDFAVAQRAEDEAESNRRVEAAGHRLNVLAACFFPIATLAAIFGMELNNGLGDWDETYGPLPMLVILGVGMLLGLILTAIITRKP